MFRRRNRMCLFAVMIVLAGVPAVVFAQYPPSKKQATGEEKKAYKIPANPTYENSALRLKIGWGGAKLIAGSEQLEVAGLGMFPTNAPRGMFSERSLEAGSLYGSYRTKSRVGALMTIVMTGMWVGAALVASNDSNASGNSEVAMGLFIGGFVPFFFSLERQTRAAEDLSRAVWLYNATLPNPDATAGSPLHQEAP